MPRKSITQRHHATFESIRQFDAKGNEFWSARDLAPLLEYQDWRNFLQVVDRARTACEGSGKQRMTISVIPPKWSPSAPVRNGRCLMCTFPAMPAI